MKFRPTSDYVLVKRTDPDKTTVGGLYIPETHQLKSRKGEVLAVGPGRYADGMNQRIPMDIKPGQVVLFRGVSGHEIELDGEDGYVILRQEEIEGVIEEL